MVMVISCKQFVTSTQQQQQQQHREQQHIQQHRQQHQQYFHYYLNILYGLRLTTFCIYALMWFGLLNNTTKLTAAAPHMRLTQRNNHANISELLDNLLRGYDNSIRPGFGGKSIKYYYK